MTRTMPSAALIFERTADRLDALTDYSYESLLATGIGEALTRDEMMGLADNPTDVQHLAKHCREQATRERARSR